MKNLPFLLPCGILSLTSISCAETNAKGFKYEKTSEKELTQIEKLTATAKVWRFLKYYHPQVAKGKFNWDEQLFTILEKVETANIGEELSAVFSK